MLTNLTQTPELSDAQRQALAICDGLKEYIKDEAAGEVAWFRNQVLAENASFCSRCVMPVFGNICLVCIAIPDCRLKVQANLDTDCVESYRKEESRKRDMAFSQREMIVKWEELQYFADLAGDYLAYVEIATTDMAPALQAA
jgi:hypothetical protein